MVTTKYVIYVNFIVYDNVTNNITTEIVAANV